MPYSTAYCLNDVTMTLSAASEIPNHFPQSEPAQISATNLSYLIVWKTLHSQLNNCIFLLTVALWFCAVCSCFNVLMFHVRSSIELLFAINHSFRCWAIYTARWQTLNMTVCWWRVVYCNIAALRLDWKDVVENKTNTIVQKTNARKNTKPFPTFRVCHVHYAEETPHDVRKY